MKTVVISYSVLGFVEALAIIVTVKTNFEAEIWLNGVSFA